MILEFVGDSRRDSDNSQANPSRLVNCYAEPHGRRVLKSVLGTEAYAETASVFMRDMAEVNGSIYCASGGFLWQLATQLGAIADSEQTVIAGNNGKVTVVADGRYWVWDGTSLTEPADAAFADYGSCFFLGQRTFRTERDGRRFDWSDAADPLTFDALSFATTESRDDKNIRGAAIQGNAWFFKEESIEIWALTGGSDVIALLPGAVIETGLKAFGLLCVFPNGAFFVGSDGVVYITAGTGLMPVSTVAVETAIRDGAPTRCLYYEDEGHKFGVIRFTDRPAWCYDLATKEWHERAEGQLEPWRAVASVKSGGEWFIGTDLGQIYRLTRSNADVDGPLIRRMVSRVLEMEQPFTIAEFELRGRMGRKDAAHVWLRASRDGGEIWGSEKWRDFGAVGEYEAACVWRGLGYFRRRAVVELTMSVAADVPIYADARVRLA